MVALHQPLPWCCSAFCCTLPWTWSRPRPFLHLARPLFTCPSCLPLRLRDSLPSETPNSSNGNGIESLLDWHSTLATKFIDDKLIDAVAQKDGEIRQIVLLTDGMDQRPYKLPWPPATLIFHVSSGPGFKLAENKLSEVPKSCLYRHVSVEPEEATAELQEGWTRRLRRVGYQGDRPSIWAMQGFGNLRSNDVQDVLMTVSSLAMKGSIFVGELPITEMGCMAEEAAEQHLEKLFMSYGFRIKAISYEPLGQGNSSVDGGHVRVLFVAEQLRLSDDQVTKAMREIELAEEAGDEETFEDW